MTSTYAFASTTRLLPSNQCFLSEKTVSSFYYDVNSGRKAVSAVLSCLSNMHNSFQCLHNSNSGEDIPSVEITIVMREDANMPKAQNLYRLDQIAKLEDDWNGYGSKAFSKELVEKCKDIISTLELQPKIFPTGRQSIQFQYELEDRSYLEFEIFGGKISCLEVPKRKYSDSRTFEFPISEIKRVKEIVKEFYEQDSSAE